eukprot:m.75034 g.75034  ORF g.75034 m.75034 type:complete len:367 (-) comp14554_c0_seq1:317-1417(-)
MPRPCMLAALAALTTLLLMFSSPCQATNAKVDAAAALTITENSARLLAGTFIWAAASASATATTAANTDSCSLQFQSQFVAGSKTIANVSFAATDGSLEAYVTRTSFFHIMFVRLGEVRRWYVDDLSVLVELDAEPQSGETMAQLRLRAVAVLLDTTDTELPDTDARVQLVLGPCGRAFVALSVELAIRRVSGPQAPLSIFIHLLANSFAKTQRFHSRLDVDVVGRIALARQTTQTMLAPKTQPQSQPAMAFAQAQSGNGNLISPAPAASASSITQDQANALIGCFAHVPAEANNGSCSKLPFDQCNNSCFGQCGYGCECWEWICGTCDCRKGCESHDYYCSCIGIWHPKCFTFEAALPNTCDCCA